jgi:hypothetical protein
VLVQTVQIVDSCASLESQSNLIRYVNSHREGFIFHWDIWVSRVNYFGRFGDNYDGRLSV